MAHRTTLSCPPLTRMREIQSHLASPRLSHAGPHYGAMRDLTTISRCAPVCGGFLVAASATPSGCRHQETATNRSRRPAQRLSLIAKLPSWPSFWSAKALHAAQGQKRLLDLATAVAARGRGRGGDAHAAAQAAAQAAPQPQHDDTAALARQLKRMAPYNVGFSMAACRGVLALALCCWLLPVTITEMSLPMQVSSWDNVEEWRPFVREVAQVVLDHVDSATHVEQILEHRTRVASTVSYQAEVEFAPSSDGRKRAFNATARVFDGAFDWHAVSGTTMHTRIWLDQQRKLHGPPSPPPTAHRLNLLDGRQPRDNQHQHQPSSLLPQEIPNTMVLQVQDAAEFLLTPSVRADQLVGVSVAAPDTLVSGLSILGGVAAELKGVRRCRLLIRYLLNVTCRSAGTHQWCFRRSRGGGDWRVGSS